MPPKKKTADRRYLTVEVTGDEMSDLVTLAHGTGEYVARYAGQVMREHLEAHYDTIVALFEADAEGRDDD